MARGHPVKKQRGKARYRFTRDDCRRGYQAALAKCMESWELYAWFFHNYVAKLLMWRPAVPLR